jgi:hypothetical protein
VFINTVPASIFSANLKALLISFVNIPEDRPYSVELALLMTASRLLLGTFYFIQDFKFKE